MNKKNNFRVTIDLVFFENSITQDLEYIKSIKQKIRKFPFTARCGLTHTFCVQFSGLNRFLNLFNNCYREITIKQLSLN